MAKLSANASNKLKKELKESGLKMPHGYEIAFRKRRTKTTTKKKATVKKATKKTTAKRKTTKKKK